MTLECHEGFLGKAVGGKEKILSLHFVYVTFCHQTPEMHTPEFL